MREFKGRIVAPGTVTAEAVVSRVGFNTLASFQSALQFGDKKATCGDQNNPDLNGNAMAGKALCLPQTIGSTTGGLVLYCACFLADRTHDAEDRRKSFPVLTEASDEVDLARCYG